MELKTPQEIAQLIRQTDGRVFTVKFVKRTNHEVRTMNARLGVKKYLAGGEKKFSDAEKGLITVFDMQVGGYRSFPVDNVIGATIDGVSYVTA